MHEHLWQNVRTGLNDPWIHDQITRVRCVRPSSCLRKGARKVLAMFEEAAEGTGIKVIESDCMDECTSGPNARLDESDRRIIGGIRTLDQVESIVKTGSA